MRLGDDVGGERGIELGRMVKEKWWGDGMLKRWVLKG